MINGVGRRHPYNYSDSLGVGYIFIPENYKGSSRVDFIEECYRRERVSIIIEGGTTKHDCYITQEALQNITFPSNCVSDGEDALGSVVIFLTEESRDHPVVIGTLSKPDGSKLLKEDSVRLFRYSDGNYAAIMVDGKTGSINVSTFSRSGVNGGNLEINVSNQNKSAKLSVNVKGSVEIEATEKIKINGAKNIELNTGGDVVLHPTGKLLIGGANESVLLGDKTVEVMEDMMSLFNSFRTELNKFAMTQGAASVPFPLTPLQVGFQTLNAGVNSLIKDIQSINLKLKEVKSSKISIE
jgi:hypothetical protein